MKEVTNRDSQTHELTDSRGNDLTFLCNASKSVNYKIQNTMSD